MRRLGAAVTLAALAVCVLASAWSASAAPVRVESKHFVIVYDAASFDYVQLVERGLEAAYDVFVTRSSFRTFPEPVEVRIPSADIDGMGAEYLETDAAGDPVPVIEIAPQASMAAAADAVATGLSLEEGVLSTTAHEFFHVLQDYASLHGSGDVSESAFVEPLATAVQEIVAPNANDYVDAATDFLLAPDATPFLDRGYDGGLFWVFVLDRYGGLDVVRRVMAASATADGVEAIDRAFADQGLTFFDVWAKFAAALATGTLPDAAAIEKLTRGLRAELGLAELRLPAPIAVAAWTGTRVTIDRVSEDSPAGLVLGYTDSALGSALKVSHPYGIDVIAIKPQSNASLAISVAAAEAADFRIAFVGRRGETWDLLALVGRELVVPNPDRFGEIRVVVTRGETGSGAYTVRLSPAT